MTDAVNHPKHYTMGEKYESIEVIEAWHLGHHLANVVKYIARSAHKGNELQDLKKALWYLKRYQGSYVAWRIQRGASSSVTGYRGDPRLPGQMSVHPLAADVIDDWKLPSELGAVLVRLETHLHEPTGLSVIEAIRQLEDYVSRLQMRERYMELAKGTEKLTGRSDDVYEEMDRLWYALTAAEQDKLDACLREDVDKLDACLRRPSSDRGDEGKP